MTIKITAEMVKELRDATGVSVMQCKNALEEGEGDVEKALIILKKKSSNIALKKADRDAKDGIIIVLENNDKTLLGNYTNTSINSAIGILNDKFIDNTKIYFNFWFDMHVNNIFTKKYNTPNQYQVHTHHSSHYKTKMKKITKKQPVIIEDISAVIHYIKNLIIDKYKKENIVDVHIKNTWFDVGYKNNNDIIIQFKFAFNLFANFKKTETQINLNDIIEIINISLKDTQ